MLNRYGLHARAAARIVELAQSYESELYFSKNGVEVDGRNVLSILSLGLGPGAEVQVRIKGSDSKEMMMALMELFNNRFGE